MGQRERHVHINSFLIYTYDVTFSTLRIAYGHLANRGDHRRLHGVVAEIANPCLSNVEFLQRDSLDLVRLVVYAKEERRSG